MFRIGLSINMVGLCLHNIIKTGGGVAKTASINGPILT